MDYREYWRVAEDRPSNKTWCLIKTKNHHYLRVMYQEENDTYLLKAKNVVEIPVDDVAFWIPYPTKIYTKVENRDVPCEVVHATLLDMHEKLKEQTGALVKYVRVLHRLIGNGYVDKRAEKFFKSIDGKKLDYDTITEVLDFIEKKSK